MELIDFLMKNGSIEFVAVMAEKFKQYVQPFTFYDFQQDYQDLGHTIRETAKRIIELCQDKELLRQERLKAKKLRGKIVGIGNTMDSYGDKYLKAQEEPQKYARTDKGQSKNPNKFAHIGSYDPYKADKTLQEKIGAIMKNVDQMEQKEKELEKREEKLQA